MRNQNGFYLKIAKLVAEQSYCKRNQVGAVIVKNNNILSFGYNGTPSGFPNGCEEVLNHAITDEHTAIENMVTKPEVLHAESNAILKCARSGLSTNDATLYLTVSPCIECCKLIIQSGIKHVFYIDEYRNVEGLKLLRNAGISYHQSLCD